VAVDEAAAGTTEDAEPAPGGRYRRYRWLGVPLLVYAASRLAQLAAVAWMSPAGGSSLHDRLLAWDGGWFVRVASEGYPHGYSYDQSGRMVGNGLAFFPGYPLLVRLTHAVTRLGYPDAALVASWLAAAAAAVVVYALGARLYDRRVGTALTVLFCAQPMSVVLSMGYSEGLFTALAAGTLLAAHRRAWLTAGGVGLAAALTRPTGAAVALALAVAALAELPRMPAGRRWRPVLAALVALLGVPAYLTWVGLRVGSWHAWFDIQTAGWGTTFDGGPATVRFVTSALRAGDGWIPLSVSWLLVAAVLAAGVAVAGRAWPPLSAYGLLVLLLVVGQGGYYHSKPRLLVPVLLTLVPAAVALGRSRRGTAVAVLAVYAAFGLWYGAYMITVWHYAI
jgi:mannosyltransferase PIG-V